MGRGGGALTPVAAPWRANSPRHRRVGALGRVPPPPPRAKIHFRQRAFSARNERWSEAEADSDFRDQEGGTDKRRIGHAAYLMPRGGGGAARASVGVSSPRDGASPEERGARATVDGSTERRASLENDEREKKKERRKNRLMNVDLGFLLFHLDIISTILSFSFHVYILPFST